MSFTPLTSSRSVIYTSPSSPYDDLQDLRNEMTSNLATVTSNLEAIETRMERQWDLMMAQFRVQSDQMSTQLQHLSVQLTNTPRPLTPMNIQSPPGTSIPETVLEEDEASDHASDNSSWLSSRPMITEPAATPATLRYVPASVPITPASPLPPLPRSAPPAIPLSPPFGAPPPHPSRTLFGGGQNGSYGPRRTQGYISGYYWESGMPASPHLCVPRLELSLQGP